MKLFQRKSKADQPKHFEGQTTFMRTTLNIARNNIMGKAEVMVKQAYANNQIKWLSDTEIEFKDKKGQVSRPSPSQLAARYYDSMSDQLGQFATAAGGVAVNLATLEITPQDVEELIKELRR